MNRIRFYNKSVWIGLVLNIFFASMVYGQTIETYPSNWFTQMKLNKVQILFRSTGLDFSRSTVQTNYPGVTIVGVHHFDNGHYIAVDVAIAPAAKVGNVHFVITTKGQQYQQFVNSEHLDSFCYIPLNSHHDGEEPNLIN